MKATTAATARPTTKAAGNHPKKAAAAAPPSTAGLPKWDRADLDALYARVLMVGVPTTKSGMIDLLPRLVAAYGDGGDEDSIDAVIEGVARDIVAGCRLANVAVIAGGAKGPPVGADGTDADGIGADGGPTDGDKARIRAVLSTLYYVNQVISASAVVCRALASAGEGSVPDDAGDDDLAAGIARFSAPDPEEANRVQQLLLYLLNTAQVRGYRRRHGEMYRRVASAAAGDHDTHAWERVCDMRDFVYETTRKEVNYDMWLNLTCMRTNIQASLGQVWGTYTDCCFFVGHPFVDHLG